MTGHLSPDQRKALGPFIRGKVVHDLGAGSLKLAQELLDLGAEKIIAVDRDPMPHEGSDRIERIECYFHNFGEPVETAFISWPVNWPTGLNLIVARAKTVIYLGLNMDGSMCGYQDMWEHLVQREVLAHVPDYRNILIVYGPNNLSRPQLPEEKAALNLERIWSYEEFFGVGRFREEAT